MAGPDDSTALRNASEALAHALPPLLVEAERVVQTVMHGVHGRRRAGPGEDFWQYRHYVRGDDAAAIDWRKSAASERVLIRENEWMAANTLWLWVQTDAGMRYRSDMAPVTKAHRAALIALALARLATRAGERVAALGADWRPDHTQAAVERLAVRFDPDAPMRQESLPPKAELPRFSTCVLIGDFFADPEELEARVRELAARGAKGHMLQVVDPAEETFPFTGRTRFEDCTGHEAMTVGKAEALRREYMERLAMHRDRLSALARRLDWTFHIHRTDAPVQRPLLALHAHIGGHVAMPHARGGAA